MWYFLYEDPSVTKFIQLHGTIHLPFSNFIIAFAYTTYSDNNNENVDGKYNISEQLGSC